MSDRFSINTAISAHI